MTMNTISLQGILAEYGKAENGETIFGRSYLFALKAVDPNFPKPLIGGGRGSRVQYRKEEVESYFKALRRSGMRSGKELSIYYRRAIQAQANQILRLVTEAQLDLDFQVRTKTRQVVFYFDSQQSADEFEHRAHPIEETLSRVGDWTFKFEVVADDLKEAS